MFSFAYLYLYHTCIYFDTRRYCRYAKTVNTIFNPIFFVQFFSSILVLCTSIYYLSRHITNSGSATFVIYIIALFVQIYVYCWSGNEVIVEVNNYLYILRSLQSDAKPAAYLRSLSYRDYRLLSQLHARSIIRRWLRGL